MLPKIDKYFNKKSDNTTDKVYPEFDYKLNFDGCSKGNPGIAGAGAVIYHFNKEVWSLDFFVGEMFTNNHAEYAGLILGLQQAKLMDINNLRVEGDSLLVINQMKGLYKCKSSNLLELYEKAKELESSFEKIEYFHVFRNANKRADELCNIAITKYLHYKGNDDLTSDDVHDVKDDLDDDVEYI
jgi:ribonuclease HI